MQNGGFDVVIGNPPYLGGQFLKRKKNEYNYIVQSYKVAEYQFDLYILFYELALTICKNGGYCSYISPNTWLTNVSNKVLRKYILDNSTIEKIVDYSTFSVFKDAVVMTAIVVLRKQLMAKQIVKIYNPDNFIEPKLLITQKAWLKDENYVFNLSLTEDDISLKSKIQTSSTRLDELADVKFGVKIYEVGKGEPPQTREQTKARIYEASRKIDASYLPYLEGKDINYYAVNWSNKWLKYGKNLAAPRKANLFTGERILVRRIMGERLICAYSNEDIISNALLQIIKPFDQKTTKSILLILGSSVITYFFRKSSDRKDKIFPEIKIHELASLPIKLPLNHDKFRIVADNILELHSLLQKNINKFLKRVTDNFELTKVSKKIEYFYQHEFKVFISELKKKKVKLSLLQQDEWEEYYTVYKDKISKLQAEIIIARAEIDKMIYQLYELSEEEIQIIENSRQ